MADSVDNRRLRGRIKRMVEAGKTPSQIFAVIGGGGGDKPVPKGERPEKRGRQKRGGASKRTIRSMIISIGGSAFKPKTFRDREQQKKELENE